MPDQKSLIGNKWGDFSRSYRAVGSNFTSVWQNITDKKPSLSVWLYPRKYHT